MEAGFTPIDIKKVIKWLLLLANEKNFVTVFEHSIDEDINFLSKNATAVKLPESSTHNYDHNTCKLTAVKLSTFTDTFINELIEKTHVLTLHDNNKMIFLAADDYHKECFTCAKSFYNNYYAFLCSKGFIICT